MLHLPRYGLGNYAEPPLDHPPTQDEAEILQNLSRAGKRLIGFCRTNLFKRLESSGSSFLQSIQRHILRNYLYLHAIESGQPLPIGTQDAALFDKINKGILLANAVTDAAKLIKQGCAKVFILWDWHPIEASWGESRRRWQPGVCRTEAAQLRTKLVAAGVDIRKVVLVCVTQEVEAWALADKGAIKDRVQARLKTHQPRHINVPRTPRPEEETDPERRLENIFGRNDVEFVKHQDVPGIFRNAAANCFKQWDSCPGFTRFVDRLLGTEGAFANAVAGCERRAVAAAQQPRGPRRR